jgi:hypothetical protein
MGVQKASLRRAQNEQARQHETQTEQVDGLFRFGRGLEVEEKIPHREKDVETQFTQALAEARRLFSSIARDAQRALQ